jgi:hypothetical protein
MIPGKQKLLQQVRALRERRGMYVAEKGFLPVSNFLVGYMQAMGDLSGVNFHRDFHSWLQQHVGKRFSVVPSYYVLNEMAGKDEALAETLLYGLLVEFCGAE